MELYANWTSALSNVFNQFIERIAQSLPNIIGAILILGIGWIVAKILRSLAIRFTRIIDKLIQRYSRNKGADRAKLPLMSPTIIGAIVFWVVLLLFITAATNILNLAIFTNWLNGVIAYLPTLFAGGLIMLAGVLISTLARDVVYAAVPQKQRQQRVLLSRIVYVIILVTAIVIGADQIGINITFLVIMLSVITATFLGGMAIAVSLGSKTTVSNLISLHFFKQTYRIGQRVRIAEFQGKIVDFTATSIVLDTDQGVVSVPAKICSESATISLLEEKAHE